MTTLNQIIVLTLAIVLVSAQTDQNLTVSQSWGFGFLTGFCLSLIGFLAALLVVAAKNCISPGKFKVFAGLLYAFSCGALIGDAAIHILPESFTNPEIEPKLVSLIFIASIVFFLILERIFASLGIAHEHWVDDNHSHKSQKNVNESSNQIEGAEDHIIVYRKEKQKKTQNFGSTNVITNQATAQEIDDKSCCENLKGKGPAGYLNLLSSFIHNFFDGFAIGVAFASRDRATYVPVIVAVFVHEIPRELGDVGVLIKNGFSGIQTILCNGFINFMSLLGVILGLGLVSISQAADLYFLTFVAGNFIYISADIWRHILKHKQNKLLNIIEFICLCLGIGVMYLVLFAQG